MFHELLIKRNELLLVSALNYFCKSLGITDDERQLISIEETKKLDNSAGGVCAGIYDVNHNIIEIKIKIKGYASTIGMLEVLAHELVHAKQHLRGEFYFERVPTKVLFGLFTFNLLDKFHGGQQLSKTPYYDRKCEQEAHQKAYTLMTDYFKLINEVADSTNKRELIVCPI